MVFVLRALFVNMFFFPLLCWILAFLRAFVDRVASPSFQLATLALLMSIMPGWLGKACGRFFRGCWLLRNVKICAFDIWDSTTPLSLAARQDHQLARCGFEHVGGNWKTLQFPRRFGWFLSGNPQHLTFHELPRSAQQPMSVQMMGLVWSPDQVVEGYWTENKVRQ